MPVFEIPKSAISLHPAAHRSSQHCDVHGNTEEVIEYSREEEEVYYCRYMANVGDNNPPARILTNGHVAGRRGTVAWEHGCGKNNKLCKFRLQLFFMVTD